MTIYQQPRTPMTCLIRAAGDLIARLTQGGSSGQGRLCIITYHRILQQRDPLLATELDLAAFRWQMKLLADYFNVLPLHDAVMALQRGHLPPRAVCITFDDGYRSVHDLALPVLRELGLPATVFTTDAYIDGGSMWNDRIIEAVRYLPCGPLDLRAVGLGTYHVGATDQRSDIVASLSEGAKYVSPDVRLSVVETLENLARNNGGSAAGNLMLDRDMIASMARQGIEIGGHTSTHPILSTLDDAGALHEIAGNKKVLEDIIGKPLRLFAYPNGKVGSDFDDRHVRMVRETGYDAAFTTAIGAATPHDDIYQIPRSRPWDATPFLFGLRLLRWLAAGKTRDIKEKRALLIAFHFPPQSDSSGIQRTLSFTKNLGGIGWEPMVISASPAAYERTNASQMANIPADVVVSRPLALDAKRHLGLFGRYPEIIALPDRWISWWLFAVPTALWLIRRHRPAVIWSTFPIATAHLIGLSLHRLTGLPWIADFRDPMMQPNYPKGSRQRKIYQWIERQAITRCSAAVFTTQGAMASCKKRYPGIDQDKFCVIENGYDEDGFAGSDAEVTVAPEAVVATPTTAAPVMLLHSGVLYEDGRDPTAFFQAIGTLKQQGRVGSENFRVILRAPGDIPYFRKLAENCGVGDVVSIEPPVPYRQALHEMLNVDGLLLFQGTPFNTQIPAKIYEYFRARKPVMGLLDTEGESAKALEAAGFRHLASMKSAEAIAPILDDFVNQVREKRAHVAGDALILASSRAHRARQLADLFERAIHPVGVNAAADTTRSDS